MLCGGVSVSLGGAGGARWCAESSGTNERENKDAIHVAGIGEACSNVNWVVATWCTVANCGEATLQPH